MMAMEADGELGFSGPSQAIGPYLQAVKRHWRLVALITVIAVVIAGRTAERAGQTYSATASILVTPLPEGDSGFVGIGTVVDTGDPARTIQTAAALIDTPEAARRAAALLGKPWTEGSVSKAVTVNPLGASDVLAVAAQASTPPAAQRVANAFAQGSISYRADVVQGQIQSSIRQLQARLAQLGSASSSSAEAGALATALEQLRAVQGTNREPTMSVSQTAGAATSNGASKALILLLALLGGIAIGSIAALALETFSRPVRDREEIASLYPLPVLAAIPEVPGRRKEVGTPPWTLPAYAFEQLRMLRVQLSLSDRGPVIMVTSAGAGDGKTTVAAALAAAFAEADRSVLLMDMDLRKPELTRLLGAGAAMAQGTGQAPTGVPVDVPLLPGVRLVRAPNVDLSQFERMMHGLPLVLAQARKSADVVIIDVSPVGEVSEALRIAAMCDQVLFVARPRHTDRRRLVLARDLLRRAGIPPVGIVLVGKETGLPKGHNSYAYEMRPVSANMPVTANGPVTGNGPVSANGGSTAEPPTQAPPLEPDAAASFDID
jgi:Mrp family chromosome partitioning ATPase/capsular polysaccharide biosynthesis protein